MEVIRRSLEALQCPSELIEVLLQDLTLPAHQARLIEWLEDRKICELEIEDRFVLRTVTDESWPRSVGRYLSVLGCPYHWSHDLEQDQVQVRDCCQGSRLLALQWLCNYAVSLDYEAELQRQSASELQRQIETAGQKLGIRRNSSANEPLSGIPTSIRSLRSYNPSPLSNHLEQLFYAGFVRRSAQFSAV